MFAVKKKKKKKKKGGGGRDWTGRRNRICYIKCVSIQEMLNVYVIQI